MSAGSPEKLVYMANQIAGFFVGQPGEPAVRIADHLTAFWTPPMRQALVAYLDAGGDGLTPEAAEAARLLRGVSPRGASPKTVGRALAASGQPSPGRDPGDDAG